jgi:hypothetical protein
MWHEGEYVFTKDVTLKGAVPIYLLQMRCPSNLDKGWGTTVVVKEQADRTRFAVVRDAKHPRLMSGILHGGGYAALMPSAVGYNAFLAPPGQEFSYAGGADPNNSSLIIGLGHDGQVVKAGTVMHYKYAVGTFADDNEGNALLEDTAAALNLGGGSVGYPFSMRVGQFVDGTFFFTARAVKNEAAFTLGPRDLIMDLPLKIENLEDNGCTAVYSTKRPWFRYVPVVAGTAYFQEPILPKNDLWVGNVFVCDNKAVKLTLVVDGQAAGKPPWLEVHNPTDQAITATLASPLHTPLFGGISARVTIPAGDSLRLEIVGKMLVRQKG